MINTRRPRTGRERRVRRAVSPAIGRAAASDRATASGIAATASVVTARCSAQAPGPKATTGVPTAGPVPSAAGRTTTPAAS